ncbi:hypothetical protein E2C01_084399 [Portunus trituberculatus]|uniref:Uncharacterized protein n=1 Tax=Portunus trituberculatus TaxID=210409 RepID=A0A5B7IV70_PORTR|nr:hypothetical protein [Portunus trituberculatus]
MSEYARSHVVTALSVILAWRDVYPVEKFIHSLTTSRRENCRANDCDNEINGGGSRSSVGGCAGGTRGLGVQVAAETV